MQDLEIQIDKIVYQRREEFMKSSFDLYNIKISPTDTRTMDLIMREVYLDFYSKSLDSEKCEMEYPYSKRNYEELIHH